VVYDLFWYTNAFCHVDGIAVSCSAVKEFIHRPHRIRVKSRCNVYRKRLCVPIGFQHVQMCCNNDLAPLFNKGIDDAHSKCRCLLRLCIATYFINQYKFPTLRQCVEIFDGIHVGGKTAEFHCNILLIANNSKYIGEFWYYGIP